MFKTLATALYERVFLHYKPTLIGIGVAAAIVALDTFTTALQGMPEGWAKIAAAILAAAGALVKSKQAGTVLELPPRPPPAP